MGINQRQKKKDILWGDGKGKVCGICKKPVKYTKANLDHIIPQSKGGRNNIENLQLTHFKCNSSRGNSILTT
jgi:5-methylcytosine-specific restriction endonuclease McrA